MEYTREAETDRISFCIKRKGKKGETCKMRVVSCCCCCSKRGLYMRNDTVEEGLIEEIGEKIEIGDDREME